MNKRLSLAAALAALGALMLCVSYSFAKGRLEEAANQRAKACNDAYWTCMGKCQGAPFFQGLCEYNCKTELRACRDKANLPRTTGVGTVSPQVNPGTSATPRRPIDGSKVGVAGVATSATPGRRVHALDENLKTQQASPIPTKSSPTPSPKPKPTATVSRKSSK